MTAQAEQADGAGAADLVVEGAAVVEVVGGIGGRAVAVPARNAAQSGAILALFFGWDVAVDAGRAIIGKGHAGHGGHAGAFVQAGEVVLGTENRASLGLPCEGGQQEK